MSGCYVHGPEILHIIHRLLCSSSISSFFVAFILAEWIPMFLYTRFSRGVYSLDILWTFFGYGCITPFSAFIVPWHSVCVCVCVWISSLHMDTHNIMLIPIPSDSFLTWLPLWSRHPVSKKDHILKFQGLGRQHMNLGVGCTIQPRTLKIIQFFSAL